VVSTCSWPSRDCICGIVEALTGHESRISRILKLADIGHTCRAAGTKGLASTFERGFSRIAKILGLGVADGNASAVREDWQRIILLRGRACRECCRNKHSDYSSEEQEKTHLERLK
jgi:hypothetical protein